MKSSTPWAEYIFMRCQRIGLPPTSTIGLGRRDVSSASRVPRPPARMTAFTIGQGSRRRPPAVLPTGAVASDVRVASRREGAAKLGGKAPDDYEREAVDDGCQHGLRHWVHRHQ